MQAYILVQTEVGKAAEVAMAIGQITGVTQADDVTGPYDVIVRAEADNVDDLGRLVVAQIQGGRRHHQDADLPDRAYLGRLHRSVRLQSPPAMVQHSVAAGQLSTRQPD